MKANIKFASSFIIPKTLPHADDGQNDDPIFCDDVCITVEGLVLLSNCGSTCFREWTEEGDHFIIPADISAQYCGAFAAMNSVWGITFPECEITDIESTIGRFATLEDYITARNLVLPVMRNVARFLKARHCSEEDCVKQADEWLNRLKSGLAPVIQLDTPGNPIHADGTTGWLQ
jgi:hypothetical protein